MMADDVVLICACPECGAGSQAGVLRCWLCGHTLADVRPAPGTRPNRHIAETQNTFSLSTVFLVVTLASVAAGVFAAAPGLGILFLVIATPALARTMVVSSRRKRLGVATTPGAKVLDFMQSAGVVVLILFCIVGSLGFAAFTACTGGVVGGLASRSINKEPEAGFIPGAVVGGLVALACIGAVLCAVWKSRRRRR